MTATTAQSLETEITGLATWDQWMHKLQSRPAWFRLSLVISLMAFIGWLDLVTGWELSLFVFYLVPVLMAVWLLGRNAGLVLAFAHGPIWWLANFSSQPYETSWGYNWAMISRIIVFGFIALGASAMRSKQETDAARIKMLEKVRQLQAEIVSAAEYQQQRIGQDLHDGLCQQLAAIGCAARALAEDLQLRSLDEAADAEKIESAIQQAVLEARSMARGIFPVHVDHTGLSTALAELAQNTQRLTGMSVEVKDAADVQIENPEVSMHLYRIAQEAVANAVRHSGAAGVQISLFTDGNHLVLSIADDGTGTHSKSSDDARGMGLRTMQYRAHAIGALLDIFNPPGGGTTVRCRLKVKMTTPLSSLPHD